MATSSSIASSRFIDGGAAAALRRKSSAFTNFRFPDLPRRTSMKRLVVSADLAVDAEPPKNEVEAKKDVELQFHGAATIADAKTFIEEVSSMIKLVHSKDIVELELRYKDCEITIRKAEALETPMAPPQGAPFPGYSPYAYPPPMYSPLSPQPAPFAAPTPAAAAAAAAPQVAPSAASAAEVAISGPEIEPLRSPMSGTFYRSSSTGQPPYVEIGDKVKKGQTLCIVEAMKLMNTVESEEDGTIVDILVQDKDLVELGTPLFVIKP